MRWVEKNWDMHTHASHFRPFLCVSHDAAQFYLGTTGAVIQIGWRWQLWIPAVWCHSLWMFDRQRFLRLMPVFPFAPKHGNYTSVYVPLVQACNSNSESISAAVLLRITAWQRGVTMCMLSWKNVFRDNTLMCHLSYQWWNDAYPSGYYPLSVFQFWSNIRLHCVSYYNVEY